MDAKVIPQDTGNKQGPDREERSSDPGFSIRRYSLSLVNGLPDGKAAFPSEIIFHQLKLRFVGSLDQRSAVLEKHNALLPILVYRPIVKAFTIGVTGLYEVRPIIVHGVADCLMSTLDRTGK